MKNVIFSGHFVSRKTKWIMTTALAALMMTPVSYAQDATDETLDDVDEVVVTGIRQALKDARDLKRAADTAVDSIIASDVSALPDLSVAEALARVPGVVAQRFDLTNANGGDFPSTEGGNNLIRGLAFVRSEFNGRESFSANGGRALDFGTVPPELIGSVNVYKNVTADLTEGGIGGNIDLRTLEPFDKDGAFVTLTGDVTYGDFREELSPDLTLTAGNRWETDIGEFGLLGSFGYSELNTRLDNHQIAQLAAVNALENDPTNSYNTTPSDEYFAMPLGYQLRTNDIDRDRDSFYLAGQYRNNDETLKATAKFYRIENNVNRVERTSEYFANAEQQIDGGTHIVNFIDDPAFSTSPFTSDGLAQCGTITADFPNSSCLENGSLGFQPISGLYESGVISNSFRDWTGARGARHQNTAINTDEASSSQDVSLNIQWQPADQWYVNVDAHKTESDLSRSQLWGVTNFYADFAFDGSGFAPITIIPDAANDTFRRFSDGTISGPGWNGLPIAANPDPIPTDITDPAANFLLSAADQFDENEGEAWAVKADIRHEFENDSWFDAIQFGARHSVREQTNRGTGLNWGSLSPAWSGSSFGSTHLQVSESQVQTEIVDFTDFFGGGVFTSDSQSSFRFISSALLADYGAFSEAIFTDPMLYRGPGEIDYAGNLNGPDDSDYSGSWFPLFSDGVVAYDNEDIGIVTEDVTAFYGRVDFGNEFDNGMSIDGNVGLRYVETSVEGLGFINYDEIVNNVGATTFAPESVVYSQQDSINGDSTSQYEHLLPSLNVKLNLNDESLIRFAASQNITRPNIGQLNPTRTQVIGFGYILDDGVVVTNPADVQNRTITDVNPTQVGVYGGNPNLIPIESTNFDLGYEHYWGDDNFASVTAFYKDITNNITPDVETLGFTTLDDEEVPILYFGDQNRDEVTFTGAELAYQQFFDEAPGIWANFGVQANYTYINADTNAPVAIIDANADGEPDSDERVYRFGVDDFLGTSEHTANLVGIYQDDQFEFRLAYNYRSDFLVSYSDQITGNPIFVEGEGFLDGSAKWDIDDNLQLRLQLSNILGNETELYQQVDAAGQTYPRARIKSDSRIKVGFRYQY